MPTRAKDHLGKEYPSITAMCSAYNIDYRRFRARMISGYSLKDALTRPLFVFNTPDKQVMDHKGRVFRSLTAMASHYGMAYSTFKHRLKIMPLKDALTVKKIAPNPVKDHRGKLFPSLNALADYYRIPYGTLYARLRRHSMKVALTMNRGVPVREILEKEKQEARDRSTLNELFTRKW